MNRSHVKLLSVVLAAVMVLIVLLTSCTKAGPTPTPTTPPRKVARVAVLSQFSGPFAKWGNAELKAMQLEADRINRAGGLRAGNDVYTVEALGYDDTGFVPAEMLKGAKKAVLEDKVSLMITSVGPDFNNTLGPFAQEQKALALIWGGTYFRPEYSYTIGGESGWPYYYSLGPTTYIAQNYPEVKRAAVLDADFALGAMTRVWSRIGAQGAGMQVVFDDLYPLDTVDFYPLMTQIMKSNPDVIIEGAMPVEHLPPLAKAGKDLGFKGKWIFVTADIEQIKQAVGEDYANGMFVGATEWASPTAPQMIQDLVKEFEQRWPGQWDNFGFEGWVNMKLWTMGVEWAQSIDGTKVRDALLAHDPIEHPVFGTSYWWGDELYGAKMQLMTPLFVTEVKNGKPTVLKDMVRFEPWWDKNKDMVFKELAKAGQVPPGATYTPK